MATQTKKPIPPDPETVPPVDTPEPVAVQAAEPTKPVGYAQLSEQELARVNTVKSKFADTITYLKTLRDAVHDGEAQRAFSVAITEAETASMWAVKAITWRG